MNEAKLILDIGADAGSFNRTLGEVRERLKGLKKEIEGLTGKKLATANFEIAGLQRTEKALTTFGRVAENTIAGFNARISQLKIERDLIPASNVDRLREINTEIKTLKENISNLTSLGVEKQVDIVNPNSIAGLEKKLQDLISRQYNIDISDEGDLARLNTEIQQTSDRINRLRSLKIDPTGGIAAGASKARQSLTNLSLVVQDLPFGFIAIQNNIPNVIQGFTQLSIEAKSLNVSTGTLLQNALSGTAGKLVAIGLVVSTVTSLVTAIIQKFGSFKEAINALLKANSAFEYQIKRVSKDLKDYKEQLTSIQDVEALGVINVNADITEVEALSAAVQNLSLSEEQRQNALDKLKEKSDAYFGDFTININQLNAIAEATDKYTKSLIANAKVDAYKQEITRLEKAKYDSDNLVNRLKEEKRQREENVKLTTKQAVENSKLSSGIGISGGGAIGAIAFPIVKTGAAVEVTSQALKDAEAASKDYGNQLTQLEQKLTDATLASVEFFEATDKDGPKPKKIKFDFEVPKLEEFLDAEKFYDPRKAIDRLEDYADVILDVKSKESDRAQVLSSLSKEADKVTNGSFKLFDTLKIGKSSTDEIKKAVVEYGYELQRLAIALINAEKLSKIKFKFELPKLDEFLRNVEGFYKFEDALSRLEDYGKIILDPNNTVEERAAALKKLQVEQKAVFNEDAKYFDNLQVGISSTEEITNAIIAFGNALQQSLIDKKKISDLFDSKEITSQFDSLKELAKGLPSELVPNFKDFEKEITDAFTLEFLKKGQPLDTEALKLRVQTALDGLKGVIENAQIQNALAKIFGGDSDTLKAKDKIDSIVNSIVKFRDTIANNLEKPFRDFFDTLLEDGKISLDSFVDLFKDMLKRIAAQLISAGIAKLITSILFPQTAVAGALTSAVGGASTGSAGGGILKFLGKLLGVTKSGEANFGSIGTGGMQLAGQVVFTQRGSDLVGVLNRTNGTINRVG
jgi:hypothetical protein